MAARSDNSQRPKLPLSQSFRTQATQDALADLPSLGRPTTNEQGSSNIPRSAVGLVSGLANGHDTAPVNTLSLDTENLHHRLNASGSVQAIVVDDDVLFAGLQGGDIVVG